MRHRGKDHRWTPKHKEGIARILAPRLPRRVADVAQVVDLLALALRQALDIPGLENALAGPDVVHVALGALAEPDAIVPLRLRLWQLLSRGATEERLNELADQPVAVQIPAALVGRFLSVWRRKRLYSQGACFTSQVVRSS